MAPYRQAKPKLQHCHLILLLVVMLSGMVAAATQAQVQNQPPLRFESLSITEGLSSVRVWDILQDQQGFLWIATGDGLNRYDGHTITVFRAQGPGTLSHDQVWALHEDAEGILWIGTYRGGLNRFDPETQTFIHYRHDPDDPQSLSDDRIRVLFESPREPGILWIGTYGGGLDRFDSRAGTFTHYRHDVNDPTSLPGNFVYDLFEDRSGTLWAGTNRGLAQVVRPARSGLAADTLSETISFTNYRPPAVTESSGHVSAVLEDHTETFWVGTSHAGLYRFDRATGSFTHFGHDPNDPTSLSHNEVLTLMEDQSGTLWVGTYGGGLNRFDRASQSFARSLHEPSDQAYAIVRAMYQDRSGVMWAGTYLGGALKIIQEKFRTYWHEPGNPNTLLKREIVAITEDDDGGLWASMNDEGMTHITHAAGQATTYQHFPSDPPRRDPLSHPHVLAILETNQEPGIMWFGTMNGLSRLNRRTRAVTHYYQKNPAYPSDERIYALHESQCEPDVLWIGTGHGVSRFSWKQGTFSPVFSPNGEGSLKRVRHLLTSTSDPCTIWFTSGTHGLYKLTLQRSAPGTYEVEHVAIENEAIHAISDLEWELWAQTNDGQLWLSDYISGLVAFDPQTKSYTHYSVEDGLPSNQVASVVLDDAGLLWIAASRGLVQMNPTEGIVRSFDLKDDLHGNVLRRRAVAKGPSGTLYFGGLDAITAIHPNHLPKNMEVPPVAITDFRIKGKHVPVDTTGSKEQVTLHSHISHTASLVLPYAANVITFEFASLDFTAPEKNEYAFFMEGFDADWTQAGTQHTATYTNLDPGRYTFRVRGSNNDGMWNEEGARLSITIQPPWYQTQWAYGLYVLLILGSVGGFVYLRERQARMQRQMLEATVAERTEQLRVQQAQLEAQTEALQDANALKSRFLANISHEFRTPLTLTFGPINDLVKDHFQSLHEARPHFVRAQRNGQRLLRLINQLLELSRLDAGSLRLHLERHDLAQFLRGIAALFESMAQQRYVLFTTDLSDETCWHIFDADKMEKVVVNLLSNAFKFTPPHGQVSLSLVCSEAGEACIEVADTGQGIAPEHVPHLFDRFYQVEQAATRAHEGSGIGLALAQELVALHGGRIDVESTVGVGSRFTVHLPPLQGPAAHTPGVEAPAAAVGDGYEAGTRPSDEEAPYFLLQELPGAPALEPVQEEQEATSRAVVCVVEDNADMRAYIRAHLAALYQVIEAPNGQEGLRLAKEWVPDLVLSDVMMPEMDGLALTDALKTDVRTSHIPVLLLTAKVDVEDRIAGYESGADAYLPKPFDAEELRARVQGLIEERQRLRVLFGGTDPVSLEEETPPLLPPQEAAFLAQVQEVIDANLSDADFGVSQLAEAVHMSRRQLLRKLQALITESPSELLRRTRLEKARALLQEGISAKEVAHAVGFKSYPSFSHAFTSAYGIPPSGYAQAD